MSKATDPSCLTKRSCWECSKPKKVLLYAPLLEWYYEHGLQITAVHRTIDYIPKKLFDSANMRRQGNVEAEKALLAGSVQAFGQQCLRKVYQMLYTKDENVVDKHLRSVWFEDLEEIGDAYKIES